MLLSKTIYRSSIIWTIINKNFKNYKKINYIYYILIKGHKHRIVTILNCVESIIILVFCEEKKIIYTTYEYSII